jgi:flagellar biosynthesis protein FliP
MKHCLPKFLLIFFILIFSSAVEAQSLKLDLGAEGSLTGRILQLMALMTVISLAPSILIMVTSFTRIIVVLSLLRNALGVQQTPPNPVLISLALFLTAFIMAPTFESAYEQGIKPLIREEVNETVALEKTIYPFKEFMLKHVRESDLKLFYNLAKKEIVPQKAEETPLQILIPSFMISELRRAFEIGFLVFIPFLIIDLVIASILMSMGMMMIPPIVISLPFKLIFFVLIDGWHLIAGSLVQGYGVP